MEGSGGSRRVTTWTKSVAAWVGTYGEYWDRVGVKSDGDGDEAEEADEDGAVWLVMISGEGFSTSRRRTGCILFSLESRCPPVRAHFVPSKSMIGRVVDVGRK